LPGEGRRGWPPQAAPAPRAAQGRPHLSPRAPSPWAPPRQVCVGEDGLGRGSAVAAEVHAPKGIGEIKRCRVERGESGYTSTGDGWYLDVVEVRLGLALACLGAWGGAIEGEG
jgi:hypothetical protein